LQQAATNLWRIELLQSNAARPVKRGEREVAPEAGEQRRLVEEYPEFEAEFGLPPGLDLAAPPEALFPPPTPAIGGQTDPRPRHPKWTSVDIELERLDQQRPYLDDKTYGQQVCKIQDRIRKKVHTKFRKQQEAEWVAEAERRNVLEEEKARIWRSMDPAQQRAFQLGVVTGIQEAEKRAEEEAKARKPVAKAAGE
jgi:hypothetical protein